MRCLPAAPHLRSGAAGPSCSAMRSSSASVSESLPHCLHEMPQYIHTGIGWEMGADFSQIFSIGSSQALFAARNEQLMIGAGQPVSLHGSAGPSVQDIDMLGTNEPQDALTLSDSLNKLRAQHGEVTRNR